MGTPSHLRVVGQAPSRDEEQQALSLVFAALSDPVRVAIYAQIVGSTCSQNCSNFLSVSEKAVPKSTLSQHFKALREAKVNTSWVSPRPEYDAAVRRFVDGLLDRSGPNSFLNDFLPFQRRVSAWGMYNALSQTLLKLTIPGVADFYQGTELWDLSLVDPDNRRPVDLRSGGGCSTRSSPRSRRARTSRRSRTACWRRRRTGA